MFQVTLLDAFRNEDNCTAWDFVRSVVDAVGTLLVNNIPASTAFSKFAVRLVRPAFQKVGWDPRPTDTHLDKLLRTTLISMVGFLISFWNLVI